MIVLLSSWVNLWGGRYHFNIPIRPDLWRMLLVSNNTNNTNNTCPNLGRVLLVLLVLLDSVQSNNTNTPGRVQNVIGIIGIICIIGIIGFCQFTETNELSPHMLEPHRYRWANLQRQMNWATMCKRWLYIARFQHTMWLHDRHFFVDVIPIMICESSMKTCRRFL